MNLHNVMINTIIKNSNSSPEITPSFYEILKIDISEKIETTKACSISVKVILIYTYSYINTYIYFMLSKYILGTFTDR